MRIWISTVLGLALTSAALTCLGDALWSPGLWQRFDLERFAQKTLAALIATGPVSLLLGLWAVRLMRAPWHRKRLLFGALGAVIALLSAILWQWCELRLSGVRWGGKIPPLPWLSTFAPYLAATGAGLGAELFDALNRSRCVPRSASSGARSAVGNRSRRSGR